MKTLLFWAAALAATSTLQAQEPRELTQLREQYQNAVARELEPLQKLYVERLRALQADLQRQGRTGEIAPVVAELSAVLAGGGPALPAAQPSTDAAESAGPAATGATGINFSDLHGVWSNQDSSYVYEFRHRRNVHRTYSYRTGDGGQTTSTSIYDASEDGEKITFEISGNRPGRGPGQWYEIQKPFSLDELILRRHHVHDRGSSVTELRLKRVEDSAE